MQKERYKCVTDDLRDKKGGRLGVLEEGKNS